MNHSAISTEQTVNSRGKQRRDELVLSAEAVFITNGYRNTSMDDIASHANASKSTLYKFFGNKESLFAEVVDRRVPNISQIASDSINSKTDIQQTLEHWALQTLQRITTPKTIILYKLLLAEAPFSPQLSNIHYANGPAKAQTLLANYFYEANRQKHWHCPDPKLAATLFVSLTFGEPFNCALLNQSPKYWTRAKVRAYVSEAVALFMNHYKIND
jgi:AcrR family transcriptional regulator